jgi:GMP synthase (glutamine-hydrolysing)
MHPRTALALTHVPFEDLDALDAILRERGFAVATVEATAPVFPRQQLLDADLVVVLGGPIGVYETADYPFLKDEIEAIAARLKARKPTVGICLGAQLIATALGARVAPGQNGSEIGWSALHAPQNIPNPATKTANLDTKKPVLDAFAPLLADGLQVLHWHGDTFNIPTGAVPLASSEQYPNQAYAIENYVVALQFHAEVTAIGLERWYVGHTGELRSKSIDIPALRAAGLRNAPRLEAAGKQFWNAWLDLAFGA